MAKTLKTNNLERRNGNNHHYFQSSARVYAQVVRFQSFRPVKPQILCGECTKGSPSALSREPHYLLKKSRNMPYKTYRVRGR